jgi:NAD+ synthase
MMAGRENAVLKKYFTVDKGAGGKLLRTELDLNVTKRKIESFIERKVAESGADGVVVGVSGGIDSAVVVYLCAGALGSRRVLGLIMPDLRVTPEEDIKDAKLVADELCIESRPIDIAPIHRAFMKNLESNKLAEGNLRARIRMALLYYHANLANRLVVGTGDRSEALLGYFTKFGDGGVDLLPIGDLYKTEVRRLGEILGIKRRIIAKQSSPRLWQGQLAETEIGVPYDVIDDVLKMHFDQGLDQKTISSRLKVRATIVEKLLSRYDASSHKRALPEICELR